MTIRKSCMIHNFTNVSPIDDDSKIKQYINPLSLCLFLNYIVKLKHQILINSLTFELMCSNFARTKLFSELFSLTRLKHQTLLGHFQANLESRLYSVEN